VKYASWKTYVDLSRYTYESTNHTSQFAGPVELLRDLIIRDGIPDGIVKEGNRYNLEYFNWIRRNVSGKLLGPGQLPEHLTRLLVENLRAMTSVPSIEALPENEPPTNPGLKWDLNPSALSSELTGDDEPDGRHYTIQPG
jgi:hypothetical protein